jgi:hypothetical protein
MSNHSAETISLEKPYEIRHWVRTLDCTEIQLYAAVRAVGHDVAAVRRFQAIHYPHHTRLDEPMF